MHVTELFGLFKEIKVKKIDTCTTRNNKTEHVQTSKPRAEIIIQQHWYFMEWNFIFYNLGVYGYWLNLNLISIHRFQVPKVFWTWNLWILNESIFSQYPMIPVNFCNSQHTQQMLSIAEHWVNFQNLFWQLLLCNIPCIMPSFNDVRKWQRRRKIPPLEPLQLWAARG